MIPGHPSGKCRACRQSYDLYYCINSSVSAATLTPAHLSRPQRAVHAHHNGRRNAVEVVTAPLVAMAAMLPAAVQLPSASLEELIDPEVIEQEVIPVSDTKPTSARRFWSHLWTAFHLSRAEQGEAAGAGFPPTTGDILSSVPGSVHDAPAPSSIHESVAATSRGKALWRHARSPIWLAVMLRGAVRRKQEALREELARASFAGEGEVLEPGRSRSSLLSSMSGLLREEGADSLGLPPLSLLGPRVDWQPAGRQHIPCCAQPHLVWRHHRPPTPSAAHWQHERQHGV